MMILRVYRSTGSDGHPLVTELGALVSLRGAAAAASLASPCCWQPGRRNSGSNPPLDVSTARRCFSH
eukprot:1190070-Rhodomonas_salina.1